MIFWAFYAGYLFYLEVVFHLGSFGFTGANPAFLIGLALVISTIQALITSRFASKGKKIAYWILVIPEFLVFAVQGVYYRIFKMPLQLEAMFTSGGDAITNFWQMALDGIIKSLPLILLFLLPVIGFAVLMSYQRFILSSVPKIQKLSMWTGMLAGVFLCVSSIFIGNRMDAEYSDEYLSYYDPEGLVRNMGVMTLVQRDAWYNLSNLVAKVPVFGENNNVTLPPVKPGDSSSEAASEPETEAAPGSTEETPGETGSESETPPGPDTSPNVLEVDWDQLASLSSGRKETKWLTEYIASAEPTRRNEYTGMFEGYNLIFLTAEAFSPYAVSEELTPTLYKMMNTSFVFTNYYVPLWQTSTSDGEYINCTGLIPDGQYSLKKSASNNLAYTLPRFFAREGVTSLAFHNNSLSYYDRYKTHPNLGYDFRALKLGKCSKEEWGDKLFTVENPNAWPASDYEMMVATLPEYIHQDRFHAYYMTISGHGSYKFSDQRMASWHKDEVAHLDLSEEARGYIACNIELDKAMGYLLEQLEAAGKLENTVICLSADHYPYALETEAYEEVAGKDLSGDQDLYRNALILWNGGMKESVRVDKTCGSMDLVPTLLNLFGFRYDSRLYAGRDIFSDEEGLVIFNDRSYATDTVIYNRKKKTTTWLKELSREQQEAYTKRMKQEVEDRYNFSAYILRSDYYDIFSKCVK